MSYDGDRRFVRLLGTRTDLWAATSTGIPTFQGDGWCENADAKRIMMASPTAFKFLFDYDMAPGEIVQIDVLSTLVTPITPDAEKQRQRGRKAKIKGGDFGLKGVGNGEKNG